LLTASIQSTLPPKIPVSTTDSNDDDMCDPEMLSKANLSCEDVHTLLKVHNDHRREHRVAPLKWDNEAAKMVGNALRKNCEFSHVDVPGGNVSLGNLPDPKDWLAEKWYSYEICDYNFEKPLPAPKPIGHLTQMLWKDNTSVGCAFVGPEQCPNGIFNPGDSTRSKSHVLLECKYNPGGNGGDESYFRANVLPPLNGSKCQNGRYVV
jgi:hypothetical protein